MRNVVQQSFVVFTIGEKLYTVVYQKYMKENVVSSEISIQNKAEMSFQMDRHRTYFRTRQIMSYFQPRGAQFWQKMSYLQLRGQNFDQICPIYNPGGTILPKNVILPVPVV